MKRLRNSSGLPDEQVRSVICWIANELGITGFDVECRSSDSTIAGRAYHQGSSYHSSARPFVVLRVGAETIDRFQFERDGQKRLAMRRSHLGSFAKNAVKICKPRFPATIKPYQYAQHKNKRYVLADRLEALVYIAAHELRHLWQAARLTDKRKSAPLSMAHGSTGKFSEIDTEAFAIHMLRGWRKK